MQGSGMMEEKEQRYYHRLYEAAAALNSACTLEGILNSIVESVATVLNAREYCPRRNRG